MIELQSEDEKKIISGFVRKQFSDSFSGSVLGRIGTGIAEGHLWFTDVSYQVIRANLIYKARTDLLKLLPIHTSLPVVTEEKSETLELINVVS